MGFYVVQNDHGEFLTNRKATPNDRYRARSGWSKLLDDAKVFSTKSAARNSDNYTGEEIIFVREVHLELGNKV